MPTGRGEDLRIESALDAAGGVPKKAAELLHIKPTTLNEMVKRHDIRPRRKRSASPLPGTAAGEHEVSADEEVVADDAR